MGLFLDFNTAFDTVNHQILLNKLDKYGIRGFANTWIFLGVIIDEHLTWREHINNVKN